MKISAYVPCCNNRFTIIGALCSIQNQSLPVDELFVVDDGSTDGSPEMVESFGVRVIRLERCRGRGASRARAMEEAKHPLVLSCDATIELPPEFATMAVRWFGDERVAAVTSRLAQREARGAVDRWRARHLFRTGKRTEPLEQAAFVTAAAMVLASAARDAGGYDVTCRHGEDADLGRRLLGWDYKVIFDPELMCWQTGSNTVAKVLERYWRWNRAGGKMTFLAYLKQIKYSVTVMAREDMNTADVGAALISLVSPHYQYWRDRTE